MRQTRSPMVAARMRRSRARPLRIDWELATDEVMLRSVRVRFTRHAELAALSLATRDAQLVEHTRRDRYSGVGGDGSGANKLGQIFMTVRGELRS
jgi:ribA/ribD-fused uncharacterized protein